MNTDWLSQAHCGYVRLDVKRSQANTSFAPRSLPTMKLLKGLSMMAAVAALYVGEARATVVVDAFTVSQITTQTGIGSKTTTATGAGILGGTRTQTVSLDALPPFSVGVASSGSPSGVFTGSMNGPNNPVGGSFFDLSYTT